MDLQLGGKTALVLAASKGLGKATALSLAREGADVMIGARDPQSLAAAADEIRKVAKGRVFTQTVDVSKPEDAAAIVAATVQATGRLDILVNNGGGPPFAKFETFDDAAWQSAFETNLMSAVRFSRLVIPHMKAAGSGRIINIISLSVRTYVEGSILSTSMRLGVTGMAKMLANELGPYNITVNNVAPGSILTDRIKHTMLSNAAPGADFDAIMAARAKEIPLGRIGRPEELADLVAFLSSTLAGYISGATIPVDGGAIKSML